VLPPLFVAVTVYVAVAVMAVGFPDITPVLVFNASPAGNAGTRIGHHPLRPPLRLGVLAAIVESLV